MAELPFGWVPWHTRGRYAATGDSELVFGLALQHQFGRLAYVDERSGVPGLHPWFDSPAAAKGMADFASLVLGIPTRRPGSKGSYP